MSFSKFVVFEFFYFFIWNRCFTAFSCSLFSEKRRFRKFLKFVTSIFPVLLSGIHFLSFECSLFLEISSLKFYKISKLLLFFSYFVIENRVLITFFVGCFKKCPFWKFQNLLLLLFRFVFGGRELWFNFL